MLRMIQAGVAPITWQALRGLAQLEIARALELLLARKPTCRP
jgi:hypothetical protein